MVLFVLSLSLRPVCSNDWVSGQPGLQREKLSQNKKEKKEGREGEREGKGKEGKRKERKSIQLFIIKLLCSQISDCNFGKIPHIFYLIFLWKITTRVQTGYYRFKLKNA